jgi:ABC-type sugar transport systems, permease components
MAWLSSKLNKFIFIFPTILVYSVFIILPLFITGYFSLTNFAGIRKPKYIGLENYSRLLGDKLFLISLKNTLIVLAILIIFLLPFSFLLSLLLNGIKKGNSLFKAMNFSPYIIAPILAGTIWMFILDPDIGLLNVVLRNLGLDFLAQQWIGGKTLTPFSIGFVYSWQIMGFHATIFLAGLKSIPNEIYEASHIDGASKVQQVFRIIIPMLRETIIINTVLIITGGLKVFELVYQLTRGGPSHLSEVVISYLYFMVFTTGQYGYGMAISVVILIISIITSYAYIRNARSKLDR